MNEKVIAFGAFHPVPSFLFLMSLIVIAVFMANPVAVGILLLGALLFSAAIQGRRFFSDIAFYLVLFILLSLANPLFSHNGATPLFFLNGNPVTLEAVLYGADIAAVMITVIVWCRCFSAVMTSDKLICVFGGILPKISLVLTMALRFIPLFRRRHKELSDAQKATGYYSEKGFVSKIACNARIFSALVTWALEGTADTAASMKARGYGLRGRTKFAPFRFTAGDGVLSFCAAALTVISILGIRLGIFTFSFYPRVEKISFSPVALCLYAALAAFSLFPFIFEAKEALRWKYLRSKI